MALRDEIVPYIDGNGLVAPSIAGPDSGKASGNGVMYTCEYYILLAMRKQLQESDLIDFATKIGGCISQNGLLNRSPMLTDRDQEGPDDYYGVLSACQVLGNTSIPRKFLKAVIRYCGFLNNNQPGKISAAFPSWYNPLHIAIRMLFLPLYAITALIIATSCLFTKPDEADPRRLGWHVIQANKSIDFLCWVASKIWLRRLYGTYGKDGMLAVASQYYQKGHPFSRYWMTE